MDITFHPRTGADYHFEHSMALMEGMRRHGEIPRLGDHDKPAGSDLAVVWSWKQMNVIADASRRGAHILVMERGFIQPREQWCSLAVDGFNGRGKFQPAPDGGVRWRRLFANRLEPWREERGGYALVIEQLPGDAALFGLDVKKWVAETCEYLLQLGWRVVFRPHPLAGNTTDISVPGVTTHRGHLAEALAHAGVCVTYNSTTAVEAVLAGVPTITIDRGSIAWPMTAHELDSIYQPDRRLWCHDMAWRQWTLEELANGTAWEHVKQCI